METKKKEIRIAFKRFWEPWNLEHFKDRFPMLLNDYEFVVDNAKPQYVMYSVFGSESLGQGVKIFYTGENQPPNMNEADWAISFRRDIASDRHMRIPNYALVYNHIGRHLKELTERSRGFSPSRSKRQKFCAFIQRKPVRHREDFVKRLMRYKQVDCAGQSLRNTRPPEAHFRWLKFRGAKLKLLEDYMLCICFENGQGNGYVTEKITDAFMAGCIPIYWGDQGVVRDFNPKAFINANGRTFDDVVQEVANTWEGKGLGRLQYLMENPFRQNKLPDYCDDEKILAFFRRIFK